GLEGHAGRTVDRLRNRAVDMALQGRLHLEMHGWRQLRGGDEAVRQRQAVPETRAEEGMSVVLDHNLAMAAVGLQHAALVEEVEDWLDAARDVAREQGDGS